MSYFDDLTLHSVSMNMRFGTAYDQSWPGICSVQFLIKGAMVYGRDHAFSTTLVAPAIYWIDERHNYQLRTEGQQDFRHFVIFSGPRGERLLREGFDELSPTGCMNVVDSGAVLHMFSSLHQHKNSPSSQQPEAVLLLERLLAHLLQTRRENLGDSPHFRSIQAAASRMRREPLVQHDLERMAHEAHLSYSHFRRLFRTYMQRSPHDFQLWCRMQWAARALQDQRVQVKEVALYAGYEDPGQFSRTFKAQIGLSPHHYRESMRL